MFLCVLRNWKFLFTSISIKSRIFHNIPGEKKKNHALCNIYKIFSYILTSLVFMDLAFWHDLIRSNSIFWRIRACKIIKYTIIQVFLYLRIFFVVI